MKYNNRAGTSREQYLELVAEKKLLVGQSSGSFRNDLKVRNRFCSMEKSKTSMNHRRKSRPVSELITLFDHHQAEESRIKQWRSETALNLMKLPKTDYKENSTTNSNLSGNADFLFGSDVSVRENKKQLQPRSEALGTKTSIMLTPRPKSGSNEIGVNISSVGNDSKKKDNESKEKMITNKDNNKKGLQVLQRGKLENDDKKTAVVEDNEAAVDESCFRKKFPLDDSLAVLRREMHSLRKQDLELMSQLLALNSSIQEIKTNSSFSSISNLSDTSDTETDVTEIAPPTNSYAWRKRESSGSDTSDSESLGRPYKKTGANRDSIDSEISGYYSNTSTYGSNASLNEYGSDCSLPPSSPDAKDPPFQKFAWGNQKPLRHQNLVSSNKRAGSDPSLNRHFPDSGGPILHHAVQSRVFYPGDERVKKLSLKQKRLDNHKNTAAGLPSQITSLSRSESDHSISGYGVDSINNIYASAQPNPVSPQKWQHSRSSCALNIGHRASSPVQNTIKVDLRNNPPMPGTAIELVLPIQPILSTRRSSEVRMAERRSLTRLKTLSKRQSMIW